MAETTTPSVLIVGAGAVGIITGYHLTLAGAQITYLVRPHRQEALSRPQKLYSYDDHGLKTLAGYELLTDPAALTGRSFDFVVITLDGSSLQADAGRALVEQIGRAFRDTPAGVILCSVGFGLRTWFVEHSGLADTQVISGNIMSFVYETGKTTMPVKPGVRPDLIAEADYAYRHYSPAGFQVDRSAPDVAEAFSAVYDRNGVVACTVVSEAEYALPVTFFAIVAAWAELGWPDLDAIDPDDPAWKLGIDALREMQRLSIFGEAGTASSEQVDGKAILDMFRQVADATPPLDYKAFVRYHHGGKLKEQQHESIRHALALGEREGRDMPATRALAERLAKH